MADKVVLQRELRAFQAECQQALATKEGEVEALNVEIERLRKRLSVYNDILNLEIGENVVASEPPVASMSIAELAERVLAESGVPPGGLHISKIAEGMIEMGWKTTARIPIQSIRPIISRMDDVFEKTAPSTFRLRRSAQTSLEDLQEVNEDE